MCKRVERICQVDPEGWYAPVIGEELVRCKDCKWADWYTAGDGRAYCYCSETGNGGNEENDFCSRAERAKE